MKTCLKKKKSTVLVVQSGEVEETESKWITQEEKVPHWGKLTSSWDLGSCLRAEDCGWLAG
jgi:hypothetical protein